MKNEGSNNKIMIIVTIIILVALICACIFIGGKDNSSSKSSNQELSEDVETIMSNLQTESEAITDDQKGDFGANINANEYIDLLNKEGEYSLVWVARPTCGYCQLTSPVIQKLIKDYSIYISYLNTDEFSDEDTQTFINSDEEFKEGFGTPMLLVVGDGKILDRIDGATDTAHYKEFLVQYKFIEE